MFGTNFYLLYVLTFTYLHCIGLKMFGSKHSYVKFMKFGVPIPMWVKSSNLFFSGDGSRRCEVSFLTWWEKNICTFRNHLRHWDSTTTQILFFSLSIFYLHHEVKLARVEQVE